MAVTVLTDASTAIDSRTLSWTIPTLATGDVVVVAAVTWDTASTLNPPSGTGLSFTERVNVSGSGKTRVYIWTAVASSGGSSVAVTSSVLAGGACVHTGACYQLPTGDGYSLAGSPNTLAATASGSSAPQGALTGTSGNLAVVAIGDWLATDGSSRAWLVSATEAYYTYSATNSTQYGARCTLTGASTTVGLSAPTTSAWTIGALEVLKSQEPIPPRPTAADALAGYRRGRRHH